MRVQNSNFKSLVSSLLIALMLSFQVFNFPECDP